MFTRSSIVVSLVLLAAVGRPLTAQAPQTLPSDDRAVVHALNRLGFGPRAGDVARVRTMGLRRWIEQQLGPSRIDDSALEARLLRLETLTLDSETLAREYHRPARQERRRPGQPDGRTVDGPPKAMNETIRRDRQIVTDLGEAKLLRAVYSERQLEEVLTDFWFNHFNVFAGKGPERVWIGEYEREAIRPYVLGNFRDMLEAVAKSPAMLYYLDNWLNSAPKAAGPQAFARRSRGINENYARELMELHTLGVDGGYAQQDIVAVARAFTGWTIGMPGRSEFRFDAAMHDTGEKTVLGHLIKAGGGIDDGRQVLDILAAHPATARFIAGKLARKFVSDEPPAALVDRAAARFSATKGDLREVLRTVITSPEFFAPEAYRAKVKTPLEFVASALRATDASVRIAVPLSLELRHLGMPLYFCQPPTGYDDRAAAWVSSGALVSRMNFALDLGGNRVRGVHVPLGADLTVATVRQGLIDNALAGNASATTLSTLAKATTVEHAVALAIGSPEFQKR